MTRITRMFSAALVVATAVALGAQEPTPAQEKAPEKQAASPSRAPVPLKIQLVLSRYQGEKKISSVPYAFSVVANSVRTSVRMGSQIPIPSGSSYSYKDVGTNIDASATSAADNSYRIDLTVADSSVYYPDQGDPATPSSTNKGGGMPAFRSFTSNFCVLLRDGQTSQSVSAIDQVTGQVLKIDTTLNVVK